MLPAPTGSPPGIERGPPPPAPPGPPTYVTGEGKGSSLEGPISPDWKSVRVKASRQPAAIFAIEDQCPPCRPGGGGAARGGRGTEPGRRRLPEGARGEAGRARAGRAVPGGLSSAWLPLRATAASPAPPSRATVETELGQPAGARTLWLPALASLIYPRSPRRGRGRGRRGRRGRRGDAAAAGMGVAGAGLGLPSPGGSRGGGCGWAAGGPGVRAGRGRPGRSPPYKAERNSLSLCRLLPPRGVRRPSGPSL